MSDGQVNRGTSLLALSVLVVCTVVASTALAQGTFNPQLYANHRTIIRDKIAFHWTIEANATIRVGLEFATTGWMGFGIGDPLAGHMGGADFVMASIENNKLVLRDHYGVSNDAPIRDGDCGVEDWKALGFTRNGTWTMIEFSRALAAPNERHDRSIVDDGVPTALLFSFSDSPDFVYHGTVRQGISINLFRPDFDPLAAIAARPDTTRLVWRQNPRYNVPIANTTQAIVCFWLPLNTTVAHMIGIRKVVQRGNEGFVHRMVLRGHKESTTCSGTDDTKLDLYATAFVGGAMVFPDDIGVDMKSEFRSFELEIHYDNSFGQVNVTDSSGVDVYITSTPRPNVASMLRLGDPAIRTTTPVVRGTSEYVYECPSSCTSTFLSRDVTVFGGLLHMHRLGAAMSTVQFRDGVKVQDIANIEYYTFYGQRTELYSKRLTVRRGDSLTTRCVYNNPVPSPIPFGRGSAEEVCMDFVYFYPANASSFPRHACGNQLCGSEKKAGGAVSVQPVFGYSCNVTAPRFSGTVRSADCRGGLLAALLVAVLLSFWM